MVTWKAWTAVAAWIIAGSLTGGYYYNHRMTCQVDQKGVRRCSDELVPVYMVVMWPAYWIGRAAVEVTK